MLKRISLGLLLIASVPAAAATGVPLSSIGGANAFLDQDFSVPIRYNFTSQVPESKCILDKLMVTGVTRLTGEVTCLVHDSAGDECNPGTFAQQLTTSFSNGTPRLVYTCRNVVQAQCPTDYVWKGLNFAQLDPGPAGSPPVDCSTVGQCVYRWRTRIGWQRKFPPNQTSVSGTVCNPDVYHATYTNPCVAVVTGSQPGIEYYPCPPCNNGTLCSTCSRQHNPTVSTTYSVSGATATCALVKNEPYGGHISAYVQWDGTCEINQPEYAPPLAACGP